MSEPTNQPSSASSASTLPVLVSSTATVLRRTQTTLGLLREVVQESSAEYWYERGKAANELCDWISATHYLFKCWMLDSSHWQGALQQSIAFAKQRNTEKAALNIQAAFEGNYADLELFTNELLAIQWFDMQQIFEEAITNNENNFFIELSLAIIYIITEERELAFKIAVNIKGNYTYLANKSASFHRVYGLSIPIEGNDVEYYGAIDAAATSFSIALECNPKHAWTYIERGTMYQHGYGGYTKAVLDYQSAIRENPKCALAYCKIRDINSASGSFNNEDEIQELSYIIDIYPTYYDAYRRRGEIKLNHNKYDEALLDLNLALKLKPRNHELYFLRSKILYKIYRLPEALTDINESINLSPNDFSKYKFRGEIKRDLGDISGALSDQEMADAVSEETRRRYGW